MTFSDVPYRLLATPEPWDAPVRRAAVSAFGFGGNNAHLVVEEHVQGAPVSVAFRRRKPVAVVGIAVAAGAGDDRAAGGILSESTRFAVLLVSA